jgi:hypothetical protein
LVYNDDDWENMAHDDAENLERIYDPGSVVQVADPGTTSATDYKSNRLTADLEMLALRSHGYPGGHGFYSGGLFGWVFGSDYLAYDPSALFYSLYVCSGSDFTVENYLAGSVVFNPDDSGLLVWGSTKTGGMWADSPFYSRLGSGDCFGAAFKAWFNEVQGLYASTIADKWWYGMVLIGDATLAPRLEPLPAGLAPILNLLLNEP